MHRYRVEIPADVFGSVVPALARLDAAPRTSVTHGSSCTLEGDIPAARVHELQQQLPGMTSGEGVLETSFDHYRPVRGPAPSRTRTDHNPSTGGSTSCTCNAVSERSATVVGVRVATWNVNSVKQRVPRLLPWLDERRPDVVCLQETKLSDDAFATLLGDELAGRGYQYAVHGQAQWNGVAILSRVGLEDAVPGLDGGPGFPDPEARAVSATCAGIRVHSVYVPNGRTPDSDHYHYKLAWLAALRDVVATGPEEVLVCGDVNIAPADADVFDPDAYIGQTHVTPPERAALAELQAVGLRDVVRDRWPHERVFTYWDYRAGMFHKDLGMRIDLVLAANPVAERVQAAWVDRHARKGTGPSDHAPVIVDLDDAPDGDIGPVVPPPSARPAKRGSARLPQT
nr:exodeoxyribonuclease III [Phytoactinopolyspora alkaliphila]